MEIHLPPETEEKLHKLARRTHKDTSQLLGEAVDYLVEYNDWFEHKVKASLEEVQNGHLVPDEDVAAWIERRERR